jgi:hypothetical protein
MKTLIKTYENDIYIIDGKTPKELHEAIQRLEFIEMPNGSVISKKSISAFQTYEDYQFQTEQKNRHKKGQYLQNGNWNDDKGYVTSADLIKITGDDVKLLKDNTT